MNSNTNIVEARKRKEEISSARRMREFDVVRDFRIDIGEEASSLCARGLSRGEGGWWTKERRVDGPTKRGVGGGGGGQGVV